MNRTRQGRTAADRGSRPRARRSTTRIAVLAVIVTATVLGSGAQVAFATDYPSWSDVQAARNSVSAKQAQIGELDRLLSGLHSSVMQAQSLAERKGAEFQAAQQKCDEATFKASELQKLVDAAQIKASKSQQQAGQQAARLARAGGSDLSARLFFGGGSSDGLLSQLGLARVVKDQSAGLYQRAAQDQNSAQSLTDQAKVARSALKDLSESAKAALDEASAASDAAIAALAEQQDNKGRLEAQRAVLVNNSNMTEADYNSGVKVAAAAAAAAAQIEKDKQAAAAAAWAAAHPPSTGGSVITAPAGGSSAGGGSTASPSGWVRPSAGKVSSPYGWRINPVTNEAALHAGTDLAPGCNAPIFAAHSGTITFAGPNGGYGNFILMNNGAGIFTGYGHIVAGGILVRSGQSVVAGQQIARVGSTGQSTGCHLHFEVRPHGVAVNAGPFMAARGVTL
jgi:murein DD-endopeptidase MepM/ murein hydrolase activator NlpD